MSEHPIAFIVLIVVNIPLYLLLGKILFSSIEDFWEAVTFWFTPDLFSAIQGQWGDDMWAELKLGLFVGLCIACVYGEFALVQKFI